VKFWWPAQIVAQVLLYISDHDEGRPQISWFSFFSKLAVPLGVMFTRKTVAWHVLLFFGGSPSIPRTHPDLLVSLRWNGWNEQIGAHGLLTVDRSVLYARPGGPHVSLSPFDMHNTLVGRRTPIPSWNYQCLSPTGNVDIAPTIPSFAGGFQKTSQTDGWPRALTEAPDGSESSADRPPTRRLEGKRSDFRKRFGTSTLNVSEV